MAKKETPLVPGRKASFPIVYGDTPSFLGCEVADSKTIEKGFDVIFSGVPWEGTVTWGSFSGCELAPRSIRHAAARYGGFLPEYDIDLLDYLRLGDLGDVAVCPGKPEETMNSIYQTANAIYDSGSIPFTLGGDHSITPEIVRALSDHVQEQIAIVHFDAHLDNSRRFGDDRFPRCGPLYRIAQIEKVRKNSIIHLGIRGPRNSPAQMEYAKTIGARVYTMREIRDRGMKGVMDEALQVAKASAQHIYVTVCSDIFDAAYNPGGPADFNGLHPHELFDALFTLGESGIDGFDYVEVYPIQDPGSLSSHLAAWSLIYALAGFASRKKSAGLTKNS